VVIGHIATGKTFVAIISIAKKVFYGDTISQNKLNIWLLNHECIIKNINSFHSEVE
jgi:phage antirepressor YoqD-like protein